MSELLSIVTPRGPGQFLDGSCRSRVCFEGVWNLWVWSDLSGARWRGGEDYFGGRKPLSGLVSQRSNACREAIC